MNNVKQYGSQLSTKKPACARTFRCEWRFCIIIRGSVCVKGLQSFLIKRAEWTRTNEHVSQILNSQVWTFSRSHVMHISEWTSVLWCTALKPSNYTDPNLSAELLSLLPMQPPLSYFLFSHSLFIHSHFHTTHSEVWTGVFSRNTIDLAVSGKQALALDKLNLLTLLKGEQ